MHAPACALLVRTLLERTIVLSERGGNVLILGCLVAVQNLLAIPYGILFVVITFFSTMGGGIFILRQSRLNMSFFFAFAAGALLGISFFDLLPEAISIAMENSISLDLLMVVVVIAFLLFHILDRFIVLHAVREGHPEHGLESSGPIKAVGLSLHSFLDGVAIGAAFHSGFELGVVVALAVVFHDFSDGLNTVAVMLRSTKEKRAAFLWLLLDSITPMLGAITTFILEIPIYIIALILPFFVGEFLYLGAADLLPEAHRHGSSARLVIATILGISTIYIVTRFLHI